MLRLDLRKGNVESTEGKAEDQPDLPHKFQLLGGQPRGLDMGVRGGGLKQGRPRWKPRSYSCYQAPGAPQPAEARRFSLWRRANKGLWPGVGPSWGKFSDCPVLKAETPPPHILFSISAATTRMGRLALQTDWKTPFWRNGNNSRST